MSLSIVEQFSFEGKSVRAVYVRGTGECLVASDAYRAIGYDRKAGVQAMQRLVPERYKMRQSDAGVALEGVLRSENLPSRLSVIERTRPLLLSFEMWHILKPSPSWSGYVRRYFLEK